MGDKYVLEKFGREANTYLCQRLGKTHDKTSQVAAVIQPEWSNLLNMDSELAFKELQKGVGSSKYTSAHIQNGYIEFRHPVVTGWPKVTKTLVCWKTP
jgi:hypothetical protein